MREQSSTEKSAKGVRVAAVWGTTVVALRTLRRGQSFQMGQDDGDVLPVPDGVAMASAPVRASREGWVLDAAGALGGRLFLEGQEGDAHLLAVNGDPVTLGDGDFGLLQYGLFAIFFQCGTLPPRLPASVRPELLALLAILSSGALHVGTLGLLRSLTGSLVRPPELESQGEVSRRAGLRRAVLDRPMPEREDAGAHGGTRSSAARR